MTALICDTETYKDYFAAGFRNVETGNVRIFELYDGQPLDIQTLAAVLRKYRIVTFNGNDYDLIMLGAALAGANNARLKKISDHIIRNGMRGWQAADRLGVTVPKVNHVDLIEVAPGIASLKIYGGRMHSQRLQDLPIDPDDSITPDLRPPLREYLHNDLQTTQDLYLQLLPQIELRERMGAEYGLDLCSKSDAQIAEAVITSEVSKVLGRQIQRPEVESGTAFQYRVPEFVRFTTPDLQAHLEVVRAAVFTVPDSGNVQMPKEIAEAEIRIGDGVYRLGIGGLHSSEKSVAHFADTQTLLVDRDVASYYPAIALRCGLAPSHLGKAYLQVYRSIVQRRLAAKRSGDKVTADSLKIVINSSFGKTGNKWSKLYSPDLLIQTTITGQLCLLMLIEALEQEGIPVVSANTDGIVIKCPTSRATMMDFVVWEWEQITGFETEATHYHALYSRDVNNYIAIKPDGGFKLKGVYAPAGLQKNPTNEICSGAVVKCLVDGTPIEDSILRCADIRKFLTLRQVKGGAVDQQGNYLGKAVRWYYARGVTGALTYKINGYTVARSEGARPLMELPKAFPDDVDFDWYINEARAILTDIGATAL